MVEYQLKSINRRLEQRPFTKKALSGRDDAGEWLVVRFARYGLNALLGEGRTYDEGVGAQAG